MRPGASGSGGDLRYMLRCLDKLPFRFAGDERLIDVGCGDGRVARLLRERVREVVAVDIEPSPRWIDAEGLTFLVADGELLPFDDASFDVVHSKDSLHHMTDPAVALAEYRRVLRPGGTLLVVEGNRYSPSFYVHMTLALGHEHFTRRRFVELVRSAFASAQFGAFEAHYVPGLRRLLPVQHAAEEALERLPPFGPLLSYNYAVASR
jgi:ubiquinone/menaquinone biosynthesis C-methylase UbiE